MLLAKSDKILTGSVIEANGQHYSVTQYFSLTKDESKDYYYFEHIEHRRNTSSLDNMSKDKKKSVAEVKELLELDIIKVISIPTHIIRVWNEVNTMTKAEIIELNNKNWNIKK